MCLGGASHFRCTQLTCLSSAHFCVFPTAPQVAVLDDASHFRRICAQLEDCPGQQANESELKVCKGCQVGYIAHEFEASRPTRMSGQGFAAAP